MLNNYIYIKYKYPFILKVEEGIIPEDAIVFIEETKEIWTHGVFFNCESFDRIEEILKNKLDIKNSLTKTSELVNDSFVIDAPNNGVYIVDINGEIYEIDQWTEDLGYTGIAVVTNKVKLIIAPDIWYSNKESTNWNGNKYSSWGGYGFLIEDGCTTSDTGEIAVLDFRGKVNTDAIISRLSGINDMWENRYTGAPAAEYCKSYSSGCKGVGNWYLPSIGELNEIVSYRSKINDALIKIGKSSTSSMNFASSTQKDNDNFWYITRDNKISSSTKYSESYVLPVCILTDFLGIKDRISNLENNKQDIIQDLELIRSNAALAVSALQSIPGEYITESELSAKNYSTVSYVDTKIANLVNGAPETLDTLDELSAALQDNKDIVNVLNNSISTKQNTITDLETIRSGSLKGATALQPEAVSNVAKSGSYNDLSDKPTIPSEVTSSIVSNWGFTKNMGTVTGVKINGSTKNPSDGIIDLGTVLTSHQDISGKLDSSTAASTYATKTELNNKQDTISDLNTIRSGAELGATSVQAVSATESIDDVSNDYITTEQLDARGYATTASVNNEINTINNTIGVNTAGFTLADRITKLEDGYDAPDARANVLWIGTSIPAGDISFSNNGTTQSTTTDLGSNNYPKMVADVLGFNLYNNSRGSSFVCFYPSSEDGTSSWANASDWTEYSSQVWKGYSLSASFAQVEEKFGPNGLNCPEWLVNNFKSYSYESLIIPYIDGTLASCDTVVIDHGYNDRNIIINEASWHPDENETQFATGAGRNWLLQLQDPLDSSLVAETYFQGKWWNDESVNSKKHYMSAMIFLCKKIWNVNPNIKIVIGNYFAKKTNVFASDFGSDRLAEFVLLANSAIANWLVVPCIDVWNYTGLYNRNLASGNDYQLFCPDNVHPHSDSTGRSNSIIAGVYINKLRGTLYR